MCIQINPKSIPRKAHLRANQSELKYDLLLQNQLIQHNIIHLFFYQTNTMNHYENQKSEKY